MIKKIANILLVTLSIFLVTGCNSNLEKERLVNQLNREYERTDEYKTQAQELKTKNLELQEHIDSLNSKILDYEKQINDLGNNNSLTSNNQKIIDELQKQNEDLINQLNSSSYSSNTNNSTINQLRNQINVLTLDLSNYKSKCEILQQQLNTQIEINKKYSIASASNSYLSIKFWYDENSYTCSNITWYSDISCTKKIDNQSNVVIASPIIDTINQSNGYTAYCCMSTTGLVYSSSKPYLIKVKIN